MCRSYGLFQLVPGDGWGDIGCVSMICGRRAGTVHTLPAHFERSCCSVSAITLIIKLPAALRWMRCYIRAIPACAMVGPISVYFSHTLKAGSPTSLFLTPRDRSTFGIRWHQHTCLSSMRMFCRSRLTFSRHPPPSPTFPPRFPHSSSLSSLPFPYHIHILLICHPLTSPPAIRKSKTRTFCTQVKCHRHHGPTPS
jgi:hypothetical protein